MNIQHSSRTDLWYTPIKVIDLARKVLNGIDFDPASDEYGNSRVGAGIYLTEIEDGLKSPWPKDVTIWCNPPGGKVGNRSRTSLFWEKLMAHRSHINDAIFMAFSAEALQTTQGKSCPAMLEFPFCIPAKRIAFDARGGGKNSPSHSNAIIYVPGQVSRSTLFRDVFSELGVCR